MTARYTPDELAQFAALREQTPPEEIAAVEREWAALLADVRASRDADPSSPEAQALLARWGALHARTMAHFAASPGLADAVARNYASGAFAADDRAPQGEDFALIKRIREARAER